METSGEKKVEKAKNIGCKEYSLQRIFVAANYLSFWQ
jgi:hypothetical protein